MLSPVGWGFPTEEGCYRGHRPGPSRDPWKKPSHGRASTFPLMGGAEEGSALPSPQSSGETPGLPWVGAAWTWLSTPSHGPGILPPT